MLNTAILMGRLTADPELRHTMWLLPALLWLLTVPM